MMDNQIKQKKKSKKITITMPEEQYQQLEEKRKSHNMGKSNYIRYLINGDNDKRYTIQVANALNNITEAVIGIKEQCESIDKVKPFIVNLEEGTNELWRSLR